MRITAQLLKRVVPKLDSLAVDGLLGTSNSLAYKVHEIEKHFHNKERWFGASADQSGADWALEDSLTTFQAISGDGVYGADANDEALVWGTGDGTPVTGDTKFDLHRILFVTLSVDTPYIIRFVWGTGTMAAAITANQYSTIIVQNIVTGSKENGAPVDVMMPRLTYGTDKVWAQAKCATDDATADFLVGIHGYTG
uniref:Uncharacterized protein n=1 Tax=viral metagenome TaxID=1070528 RepID=A0A6M3LL40_9ZZZZ